MPENDSDQSTYEYVAYIDESGDPGLSKVKPCDPNGSSEWLIVSAVVVRRDNEAATDDWVNSIIARFNNHQTKALHFSKLNPAKRALACADLANRPVRLFTVISNKKNMKGHTNPFAELRSLDKNWFYCWLTRILLERVTHWVEKRSVIDFRETRKLKLVFSTRGGLSYSQMKAYFELLKVQSRGQSLFLRAGDLRWSVIKQDITEILPHYERSGLQLADVVASAFFKACDKFDTGSCDPQFAKLLKPRIANVLDVEGYQNYSGYGVKLLPSFKGAKLLSEQKEIFEFYGYPHQWWDPASSNPEA